MSLHDELKAKIAELEAKLHEAAAGGYVHEATLLRIRVDHLRANLTRMEQARDEPRYTFGFSPIRSPSAEPERRSLSLASVFKALQKLAPWLEFSQSYHPTQDAMRVAVRCTNCATSGVVMVSDKVRGPLKIVESMRDHPLIVEHMRCRRQHSASDLVGVLNAGPGEAVHYHPGRRAAAAAGVSTRTKRLISLKEE